MQVLNSACAEEARIRYDAFGNVAQQTGTFAPRYTFSTKEFLADVKLYLYAFRVYDPVAGRWTQRDPIGYEDSPNLYQFCGNNPINKTDADGRMPWALRFFYEMIKTRSLNQNEDEVLMSATKVTVEQGEVIRARENLATLNTQLDETEQNVQKNENEIMTLSSKMKNEDSGAGNITPSDAQNVETNHKRMQQLEQKLMQSYKQRDKIKTNIRRAEASFKKANDAYEKKNGNH